jgi:hypothetical protein
MKMRRRGNNEGCIYHRKDGRWCAQVSLSGRRLTKYGKSQKECRDWIKEMGTKIGNGLTFRGTQVSLNEFIEIWLDGRSGRGDTCIGTYVAMRGSNPPLEAGIWAAAVTSMKMEKLGPFDRLVSDVKAFISEKYKGEPFR